MRGSLPVAVALATAIAVAATAALSALRLSGARLRWAVLVPVLPIVAVLADASWRIHANHGLFHSSVVYELFLRGAPPENPLFAGEPLRYPWIQHLLAAWTMKVLPLSPALLFALTGVLSLVLFTFLLDRIARTVSEQPAFRLCSVLIAMVGTNPFMYEPLGPLLLKAGLPTEPRWMAWKKFSAQDGNALGLVFFALALLGLLEWARGTGRQRRSYLWVALGCLGAGLCYPSAWPAVGVCAGAVIVAAVSTRRPAGDVLALALVLAAASAPVVPWLWSLGAGKPPPAELGLLGAAPGLIRKALLLLAAAILPVVLIAYRPGAWSVLLRERVTLGRAIVLSTLACCAAFLLVRLPITSEYKLLMYGTVPLGLLLGMPLAQLFGFRRGPALVLAFALLFPSGWHVASSLVLRPDPLDPAAEDGRYLRHLEPNQDLLYSWIAEQTPPDAVFLDTRRAVPAFARRPLWVGLDDREAGERPDGWTLSADAILRKVTGVDLRELERRRALAAALLDAEGAAPDPSALETLAASVPGRPVYVVARKEAAQLALARAAGLEPVFEGDAGMVFRLREDGDRPVEGNVRDGSSGGDPAALPGAGASG